MSKLFNSPPTLETQAAAYAAKLLRKVSARAKWQKNTSKVLRLELVHYADEAKAGFFALQSLYEYRHLVEVVGRYLSHKKTPAYSATLYRIVIDDLEIVKRNFAGLEFICETAFFDPTDKGMVFNDRELELLARLWEEIYSEINKWT